MIIKEGTAHQRYVAEAGENKRRVPRRSGGKPPITTERPLINQAHPPIRREAGVVEAVEVRALG